LSVKAPRFFFPAPPSSSLLALACFMATDVGDEAMMPLRQQMPSKTLPVKTELRKDSGTGTRDDLFAELLTDTTLHMLLTVDNPDDALDELLSTRPAEDWVGVILEAGKRFPSTVCSSETLRLVQGRVTLREALIKLGPEWAPAIRALQEAAQQRLFEAIYTGVDMSDWGAVGFESVEVLLRSGASLLRADAHGRVAAHIAAESCSDNLGALVRAAPTALLVEDVEGQTPLDLWGSCTVQMIEMGMVDALADAALECVASMPQQTEHVLRRNPAALETWRAIAESAQCGALLTVLPRERECCRCNSWMSIRSLGSDAQVCEGLAAARLRQGKQRVGVLETLAAVSEHELVGLEPQELRFRLALAESSLKKHRDESAQQVWALKQEVRQLKDLVVQREEEINLLQTRITSMVPALEIQAVNADRITSPQPPLEIQSWGKCPDACGMLRSDRPPTIPSVHALMGKSAMESREWLVIEEIRRARLADLDVMELPREVRAGMAEIRLSLAAAVERLARDLYESEAHFLQELLQNADDNTYTPGTVPSVRFALCLASAEATSAFFYSVNNEVGLTEANVRALCDISRSSKPSVDCATTGCKGVGWKSVFRVSETPFVLSGNWQFRFSSRGLGMLTPEWIDNAEYQGLPAEVRAAHTDGNTVFFLPLNDLGCVANIEKEMWAMESDTAQYIFLRRLREISLSDQHGRTANFTVQLDGMYNATVYKHVACSSHSASSAHDEQSTTTSFEVRALDDVVVAFPIVEEPPAQRVFAVLPVRAAGFNFAVNAPFELTASRADLHRSPENLRRRGIVARAFLCACRNSEFVASRCLKYLGTEPADPFWHAVRIDILRGLKGTACINTESGWEEPERCIVRGRIPAARWVPETLLLEACGLRFAVCLEVDDAVMDALGVRTFGFDELAACLRHEHGEWLTAAWEGPSRLSIFSDVFCSLVDALHAEPSRVTVVQELYIFPSLGSGCQDGMADVELCTATCLYATFCDEVPSSWQWPFVRCLHPDLKLSVPAGALLEILAISQVDEVDLEQRALRALLAPDGHEADLQPDKEITWAALAILRRCFLLGRKPPCPWHELTHSILLPSAKGDLLPPSRLRMWSFLGVELRLPTGVLRHVCQFAGLEMPHSHALDCLASPSIKPEGEDWHLGWEVFFAHLGCQPADPTGCVDEGLVETTLTLGKTLSCGYWWQRAVRSSTTMTYLRSVLGLPRSALMSGGLVAQQLVINTRLCWLRQLPVRVAGHVASLEDFFIQSAFYRLVGNNLPYIAEIPEDSQALALLRQLGVGVEVDQTTLLKCIRWLRAHHVQDIGLAADIYSMLGSLGFVGPDSRSEEFILVPGHGYACRKECSWHAFRSDLLRRCCRLEALSGHYGRFGSDVRVPLQQWVLETPEDDAQVLCDTLHHVIICAKELKDGYDANTRWVSVSAAEASEGLFEAARDVVRALARLCADETMESASVVAASRFRRQRMIAVPSSPAAGSPCCVLLSTDEAFWSVANELKQQACASMALEAHYGGGDDIRKFFTEVLGVRLMLSQDDLTRFMRSPPNSRHPLLGSVSEGLRMGHIPGPWAGSALTFDPRHAVFLALERAKSLPPGGWVLDAQPAPLLSTTGTPPLHLEPHMLPARRQWRQIGVLGGLPVFSAATSPPPPVGCPDMALLCRLCGALGLHIAQMAFAFDPSGRTVCDEQLFIDVMLIPRAAQLPSTAAATAFWALQLCQAVAHQGVGPAVDQRLLQVQSELVAHMLPHTLQSERQCQWQQTLGLHQSL